jgi:hypothetical protein
LDASFEHDSERVECGLPSGDPPLSASSGRVEAGHDEVEVFEGGLVVGEVPSGLDAAAEAGVEALDRVRIRYEMRERLDLTAGSRFPGVGFGVFGGIS